MKILAQNCQPMTDKLSRRLSSHAHPTGRVVGLPADKAKMLRNRSFRFEFHTVFCRQIAELIFLTIRSQDK